MNIRETRNGLSCKGWVRPGVVEGVRGGAGRVQRGWEESNNNCAKAVAICVCWLEQKAVLAISSDQLLDGRVFQYLLGEVVCED